MPSAGYKKRVSKWTPEAVIAAIQKYVERYDEVPTATDFNPSDSRRSARISAARSVAWLDRAARVERDDDYPYPQTVQKIFGSWRDGIVAAGLTPRTRTLDVRIAEARYVNPNELQRLIARARATKDSEKLKRTYYEIAEAAIGLAEAL